MILLLKKVCNFGKLLERNNSLQTIWDQFKKSSKTGLFMKSVVQFSSANVKIFVSYNQLGNNLEVFLN